MDENTGYGSLEYHPENTVIHERRNEKKKNLILNKQINVPSGLLFFVGMNTAHDPRSAKYILNDWSFVLF